MPQLVQPVIDALGPQPLLRSHGLELRPWSLHDADAVVTAYADPAIQQWHAASLTHGEALDWIAEREQRWTARQGGDWAVTEDGEILGRAGFRLMDLAGGQAEVAYWTLPAARGRGVAVRSMEVLAEWSFAAGFERLSLRHSTRNPASGRVAVKAGFVFEGTLRRDALHPDGWHDMHVYGRIKGARPL